MSSGFYLVFGAEVIISNEGISILENMTELGVPVPKKIIAVLEQLKPKDDDGDDDDKDTE